MANFKAIAAKQAVPLRPITLLFGPNSAGKSTIIHSLAFAHEAARTGNFNVLHTQIGGTSIDLGGFRQFVFHRDASRRVQWGAEIAVDNIPAKFASVLKPGSTFRILLTFGIQINDLGVPVEGAPVSLETYELTVNSIELLRMSRRPGVGLRLDQFVTNHPLMEHIYFDFFNVRKAKQPVHRGSGLTISDITSALASELAAVEGNLLPIGLEVWGGQSSHPLIPPTDTLASAAEKKHALVRAELMDLLCRLQKFVSDSFSEAMKEMRYLGPLRSYPSRTFAFEFERDPDWHAGGGYAWDEVRRNSEVREKVNLWLSAEWLQTRYRLSIRKLVALPDIQGALEEFVDSIANVTVGGASPDPEQYAKDFLDQIEFNSDVDQIDELVLTDVGTDTVVSHRDVGIGISQVLPVLVSSFAERNSLIAIEQPEIHLHPALQAELGDVFISSALGGSHNKFILETHSEHIMLRLLRRIRETTEGTRPSEVPPIRPSDVAVLYVMPSSTGTVVQQIHITESGDFSSPWPSGFFGERVKELF